jgi:hypothetical protein
MIQLAAATAFLTLLFWNLLDWKGILFILPLAAGYEIFHRVRLRLHLRCKECGFDPYLYALDTGWAREEVVKHWRAKFEKAGIPYPGDPVPEKVTETAEWAGESAAAEAVSDNVTA